MQLIRLPHSHDINELLLLQSLLDGSGIEHVVRHANIGSLYPGLPGLGSQVLVRECDALRAKELLYRLQLDVREISTEASNDG